jgi:aminoglycoside 6'-N-acetyltransferase I
MDVRRLNPDDHPEWQRMRETLWPEFSAAQHQQEMAAIRADATTATFVVDRGDRRLGGFLELGRRSVAEGCSTSPVAYIEGWYVDPDLRGRGIGRALVEAAERYARDGGYREIASDCELPNEVSRSAHLALGYAEVLRLIHFRKDLTAG